MTSVATIHLCGTALLSGPGATSELASQVAHLGSTRPCVVTDSHVAHMPWFQNLMESLPDAVLYDKVTPNPKDVEVMAGAEQYKAAGCDAVIGVGGGSSMDCAKAISAIVRHDGFIMDYGRSKPDRKFFTKGREPLVLVPTTIGTGSEVSPHAVITNTSLNKKSDLQESIFYPDCVVLDPELLMTLPYEVTRDTGVDALTHAVEVYTGRSAVYGFAPLHEAAALKAIELVATYLRRALFAGDVDVEAKGKIQWAATLAGFALDLDAGCAHGMAGVLQTHFHDLSHGASVGVLLPSVMDFNLPCAPERFADIARAFGEDTSGLTDLEAGELAIADVRALLRDIAFPRLADYMSDPSLIDEIAPVGAGNSCNKNNVRSISVEQAAAVYQSALEDDYR